MNYYGSNQQPFQHAYTLNDLLKGKNLDFIAAALLVSGKLKVDSVELFRGSPVIVVSLLGAYQTLADTKADEMGEFLKENGDVTLDELYEGIKKRMPKNRKG
ncbi:hypothetical protein AB3N04_04390 [Alkalihalophilus sp. As8PL]|uniref:Uncharacterized protein n=1 Tax=Alkalihalophilus sp. As8PL TaxID=3237103 RepID=A0AB39BW55_9BACI